MRALLSGKSRSARYTLCSRATRGQLAVFSFRLHDRLLESTLWPPSLWFLSCDDHHKPYARHDKFAERPHTNIFFTNEKATFVGIIVTGCTKFHSMQMILKVSGRSYLIRISWNLAPLYPKLTTLSNEPFFLDKRWTMNSNIIIISHHPCMIGIPSELCSHSHWVMSRHLAKMRTVCPIWSRCFWKKRGMTWPIW